MTTTRRARTYPEHAAQSAVFTWAALASGRHPELRLLYAVPNWAGVKGPADGARRKREGVRAGVPDTHLPVARGPYIGLYVEMKSPTGQTTKMQRKWIAALREAGHRVEVCRSFHEARHVIEQYLSLPKPMEAP